MNIENGKMENGKWSFINQFTAITIFLFPFSVKCSHRADNPLRLFLFVFF